MDKKISYPSSSKKIQWFCWIFLPFLTLSLLTFSQAQESDEAEIDNKTVNSIERGLQFLSKTQNKDGSWSDVVGRKVNNYYMGQYGTHVGVTALAGMSLLAGGYLPGRGKYGDNIKRTIDFFVQNFASKDKNPDGFVSLNESRMYSHAFVTLFLAEAYGMTHQPELRTVLKRAVRLIEISQNKMGGWRYLPGAKDSDISITVCQLMALRGARNAGIVVDPKVIKAAINYVLDSYISYPSRSYRRIVQNGFWYQKYENQPSRTSYALTAAGVASLFAVSEGRGLVDSQLQDKVEEAIKGGLSFLMDSVNRPPSSDMDNTFDYFYGHYYAAQAMYQAGNRFGKNYWVQWYKSVRDEMVSGQRDDGRWEDLVGANYATAMATLILQIPYRYLPIFQR